MHHGQLDHAVAGRLDVEGDGGPGLGRDGGEEPGVPAEPFGQLRGEAVPGVGQVAERVGLDHYLLRVGQHDAVVVPGHRGAGGPFGGEGRVPVALGEGGLG